MKKPKNCSAASEATSLPIDDQIHILKEIDQLSETLKKYIPTEHITQQERQHAWYPREKEPEYRMGMVLRKAHAGVFIRDLVNKTVTWSPELYELLGIDPELSSKSQIFMKMIHPDDYDQVIQDTQAAIDQGGTFYQEFRVVKPDGECLWLSSIGYVEQDEHGQPVSLIGINQDISKRKIAEQAQELARVEALIEKNRLLAVMEALPIGVAILNLNGEIIQASRGFEEVWGGPTPHTQSIDDFSVFEATWLETGKPVRANEWAAAQAIQQGKTVNNQLLEIAGFNGVHRFVLNSAAPFYDADGQISGCAVAILDITEYVESRRALQKSEQSRWQSEELLRVSLSSLPLTAYTLDCNLRYTWVYHPTFGTTEEQMLGKRDDELFPGVSEEYLSTLRKVMETGGSYQREVETEIFGPKKYILQTFAPFRDQEGTIIGLIGASLDITAQRQLEIDRREALRQLETQRKVIEQREKERQVIAREIHDGPIQTLVGMLFNLQITKEDFNQQTIFDELNEFTTTLKGAVRELREVVNNLRPPALLRNGLERTLAAYAEDFRQKHPELDLDLLFDVPDEQVYFNETTNLSIYRLCQEGLSNILRHAAATRAIIRFTRDEGKIVLEIQDNGKGFDVPEDFSQKARMGHFGLAGMKERVEAIGGEIAIRSNQESGTVIRVRIPYQESNR